MFQDFFFIPYTDQEATQEEEQDQHQLLEAVETLAEISSDINEQLGICTKKLETVDESMAQVQDTLDSTVKELHATKNNSRLQVAVSSVCTVIGAGVCSVPFIPLLGAYAAVTGTVGGLSAGILGWNFS